MYWLHVKFKITLDFSWLRVIAEHDHFFLKKKLLKSQQMLPSASDTSPKESLKQKEFYWIYKVCDNTGYWFSKLSNWKQSTYIIFSGLSNLAIKWSTITFHYNPIVFGKHIIILMSSYLFLSNSKEREYNIFCVKGMIHIFINAM